MKTIIFVFTLIAYVNAVPFGPAYGPMAGGFAGAAGFDQGTQGGGAYGGQRGGAAAAQEFGQGANREAAAQESGSYYHRQSLLFGYNRDQAFGVRDAAAQEGALEAGAGSYGRAAQGGYNQGQGSGFAQGQEAVGQGQRAAAPVNAPGYHAQGYQGGYGGQAARAQGGQQSGSQGGFAHGEEGAAQYGAGRFAGARIHEAAGYDREQTVLAADEETHARAQAAAARREGAAAYGKAQAAQNGAAEFGQGGFQQGAQGAKQAGGYQQLYPGYGVYGYVPQAIPFIQAAVPLQGSYAPYYRKF